MNILITGGTGYLGSHLVLHLVGQGHQVAVVARGWGSGTTDQLRFRRLNEAAVTAFWVDLAEPGQLASCVRGHWPEVIIHGVSNFLEPRGRRSLTVTAMAEVLGFARTCPRLRLMIDLSNNLVLGDTLQRFLWPDEEAVCVPNTTHGWNKLEAELLLRCSDLPWTVLRISQVYGGFGSSFDWIVLNRIRKGKLPLPGNGSNRIGLVHIADVNRAVELVVEKMPIGEIINICSGDQSLIQSVLFDFLAEKLGAEKPKRLPYPLAIAYAAAVEWVAGIFQSEPSVVPDMVRVMAMNRVLDISKAKKVLGYRPEYSNSLDGLAAAYAEVFAGRAKLFVPPKRFELVRGGP